MRYTRFKQADDVATLGPNEVEISANGSGHKPLVVPSIRAWQDRCFVRSPRTRTIVFYALLL
jgi:hypothetical protein